jgi:hypothetical protein
VTHDKALPTHARIGVFVGLHIGVLLGVLAFL